LYHAKFTLTRASSYSSIVTLKQRGGLKATYYKTTDFQAPFNDMAAHSHVIDYYTQVDPVIDFVPLEKAF